MSKDLELEKNALVSFHAKLRDYCRDRNLMCDGGDEAHDCPFVEYCFRAAAELSDESVKEAFDALILGLQKRFYGDCDCHDVEIRLGEEEIAKAAHGKLREALRRRQALESNLRRKRGRSYRR